jgi:hypothetical protein
VPETEKTRAKREEGGKASREQQRKDSVNNENSRSNVHAQRINKRKRKEGTHK